MSARFGIDLSAGAWPVLTVHLTTSRKIARLLASKDRRQRKRGSRLYRQECRRRWRSLQRSFESMAVAAQGAAAQLAQLGPTLQRLQQRGDFDA